MMVDARGQTTEADVTVSAARADYRLELYGRTFDLIETGDDGRCRPRYVAAVPICWHCGEPAGGGDYGLDAALHWIWHNDVWVLCGVCGHRLGPLGGLGGVR